MNKSFSLDFWSFPTDLSSFGQKRRTRERDRERESVCVCKRERKRNVT